MEELIANAGAEAQLFYTLLTWTLLLGGALSATGLWLYQRRHPANHEILNDRIAERAWSTPQLALLLGALLLLYTLASASGRFFYEDQIPLVRLVVTLAIYAAVAAIITAVNRRRGGSWESCCGMGLRQARMLLLAPVFYLAFIPVLMLATKAYHVVLQQFFHVEIELQEVAQVVLQELSWVQVCYVLVAILIAPVYEELLFRGIIFPYLAKRLGTAGGTAVVSALFAGLHFHLPSFVPLYLLSAALCLVYWRTGSLWTGIGMHMLFNAVTILALNMVG